MSIPIRRAGQNTASCSIFTGRTISLPRVDFFLGYLMVEDGPLEGIVGCYPENAAVVFVRSLDARAVVAITGPKDAN